MRLHVASVNGRRQSVSYVAVAHLAVPHKKWKKIQVMIIRMMLVVAVTMMMIIVIMKPIVTPLPCTAAAVVAEASSCGIRSRGKS